MLKIKLTNRSSETLMELEEHINNSTVGFAHLKTDMYDNVMFDRDEYCMVVADSPNVIKSKLETSEFSHNIKDMKIV